MLIIFLLYCTTFLCFFSIKTAFSFIAYEYRGHTFYINFTSNNKRMKIFYFISLVIMTCNLRLLSSFISFASHYHAITKPFRDFSLYSFYSPFFLFYDKKIYVIYYPPLRRRSIHRGFIEGNNLQPTSNIFTTQSPYPLHWEKNPSKQSTKDGEKKKDWLMSLSRWIGKIHEWRFTKN